MKYWKEYSGHDVNLVGSKKIYDETIYSFDIETTSFLILNGRQIPASEYEKLTKKEQEEAIPMSNMYIWMLSINDIVYYGRTWEEFEAFLYLIDYYTQNAIKIVFVHNLSYEFQFMRNKIRFKEVFARKSRKVMKCTLEDYNFEFRCSLMMTNCKLEKIPSVFQLDVKKLVGNLDYTIQRNSLTTLTEDELAYCENDCLVLYEYIKKELLQYERIKNIPITSTGKVRREFKEKIKDNYEYKSKVKLASNTDGHIHNLLLQAFMGGYTHSNWTKTNKIIKNVTSYDFTSSYPYVMVTSNHFPISRFYKSNIKKIEDLKDNKCYLIKVRFENIMSKYWNSFISASKCLRIKGGKYDNGRLIGAELIEITLTDIDLKFFFESHTIGSYEFLEVYQCQAGYLPKDYIEFVLDKYILKTKYKNVAGKELEYSLEKR